MISTIKNLDVVGKQTNYPCLSVDIISPKRSQLPEKPTPANKTTTIPTDQPICLYLLTFIQPDLRRISSLLNVRLLLLNRLNTSLNN
ncbi:MAG TPA: hypothetical protein V6C71_05610 [Coleofasciculaceae cyanobacterium]|jgi:hypothetical protein